MARLRFSRLLALLRRRAWDRRVDEDLAFHVRMETEENIRRGLAPADALAATRRKLGNLTQASEEAYRMNTISFLEETARNIRLSVRALARSWGFTLGAGSVLAIAIGASIAIFSVVSTVLLQPLPYPDAERIVSIETFFTNTGQSSPLVSRPDFLDWRDQQNVFEAMALFSSVGDTGTTVGGRATFSNTWSVSAGFFEVFGQTASAGRLLAGQDFQTGAVAVVAHPWAVTHFGSAAAAIGQSFVLYGARVEVVGVTAPEFRFPGDTDLWLPWNIEIPPGVPAAVVQAQRGDYSWQAVGKLAPGVPFTRGEAAMRTIGDRLAQQYPVNRLKTVALIPLQERLTGSVRMTLLILLSAVAVLWLIACANIANLLLARAAGRTREIALRAALGAGRGRVVWQLLTESCVLAAVAGLAGLLLAFLLVQGVVAFSPADLPRIGDVRIDTTALLFALGLSLLSTAFFGLIPALHASQLDLSDALKQGGSKATVSKPGTRLRSGLVVAEVALSVVLLAAAGLLVRSFQALQHVDLGFARNRVLAAYTEYPIRNNSEIPDRIAFFAGVLDRLRAVPGVDAAAGAAYLGMGWEPRELRDMFIDGRPEGQAGERPQAEIYDVTEEYFKTLEIPILAGRDFSRTDTQGGSRVVIVNQSLARAAFPGESAIGKRIRETPNSQIPWLEIIGVVGDTRWQDPSQPAPPAMFRSAMQGTGNSPSLLVRTSAGNSMDEASIISTLRGILNDANPAVPVEFKTMEAMFDSTLRYPRFRTQVIGLFAGMAALLATVGIFSVLAYLVGQRTRELAVRRALGAQAGDVIRLIVGQGLRLVAAGLVLGLIGSLAVSRLLTGLLYEISPWDAGTYLGTIAVLGSAALVATLLPAIRAAAIKPLVALREN